jgi:hypothetical protein
VAFSPELSPVFFDVRAWVFVTGTVLPDGSIGWDDIPPDYDTRAQNP